MLLALRSRNWRRFTEHVLVKARYWLLSHGICMDGVHFLTHTVSYMYSNIIRSFAPSFYKWSRRFSISHRFVSCISRWRFTCLDHFVLLDLRHLGRKMEDSQKCNRNTVRAFFRQSAEIGYIGTFISTRSVLRLLHDGCEYVLQHKCGKVEFVHV